MDEGEQKAHTAGRTREQKTHTAGRTRGRREKVDQVCVSSSYFLGVEIGAVATEQEETH